MPQGFVNKVPNETWTHSCSQFECFFWSVMGIYRSYCPFFLECVYFILLYSSLIFDIFLSLCVCVRMCVGVVLGLTNSYFSLCVCKCVPWGFFFVCGSVVLIFTGNSFLYISLYIYIYIYTFVSLYWFRVCMYICICLYLCFVYICVFLVVYESILWNIHTFIFLPIFVSDLFGLFLFVAVMSFSLLC